jgi:aminopeptidase N
MSDRVLLPEGVTPTHYSLDLRPRLEQLEYYCDERIAVTVSKAGLTEVSMHFKEIYVESASFASAAGASCKCVEISYNTTSNVLKLGFDAALPEGEGTISLKFRGILNGDMCGFYKSEYVDANGKKKVMASTQFEALDARRYAPPAYPSIPLSLHPAIPLSVYCICVGTGAWGCG